MSEFQDYYPLGDLTWINVSTLGVAIDGDVSWSDVPKLIEFLQEALEAATE